MLVGARVRVDMAYLHEKESHCFYFFVEDWFYCGRLCAMLVVMFRLW
jgi:hypothetical protein